MIGKIPYSVAMSLANPAEETSAKVARAYVQRRDVVTLEQLAQHIKDHGSVYSQGTILGVMVDMIECTIEQLGAGYKVDLGSLGRVGVTLTSKPADTIDEFTAANITSVKPIMEFSDSLKAKLQDAEFEQVSSRVAQAATLAAQKAGRTAADWTATDDSGEGGEGGGNGDINE